MEKGLAIVASLFIATSSIISNSFINQETIVTAVSSEKVDSIPTGYTAVYTIEDLYAVRKNPSGKYILMNDIDLSETAPGGDWDNGNGWLPIDDFSGVFDGNCYSIKNMHIYGDLTSGCYGLFGYCDTNEKTKIYRLSVVDYVIDCRTVEENIFIGGISGTTGYQTIDQCYTSGEVNVSVEKNYCYVGGITGGLKSSSRIISNSFNTADITVIVAENIEENTVFVGGVTGIGGRPNNVYNIGKIACISQNEVLVGNIGGIILSGTSDVNYYYLKTLGNYKGFGNTNSDISSALTIGQMKSSASFTGFDFENIWEIDSNNDYPYPTLKGVPYVCKSNNEQSSDDLEIKIKNLENQIKTLTEENQKLKSRNIFDINSDGTVNILDLIKLKSYFLNI